MSVPACVLLLLPSAVSVRHSTAATLDLADDRRGTVVIAAGAGWCRHPCRRIPRSICTGCCCCGGCCCWWPRLRLVLRVLILLLLLRMLLLILLLSPLHLFLVLLLGLLLGLLELLSLLLLLARRHDYQRRTPITTVSTLNSVDKDSYSQQYIERQASARH